MRCWHARGRERWAEGGELGTAARHIPPLARRDATHGTHGTLGGTLRHRARHCTLPREYTDRSAHTMPRHSCIRARRIPHTMAWAPHPRTPPLRSSRLPRASSFALPWPRRPSRTIAYETSLMAWSQFVVPCVPMPRCRCAGVHAPALGPRGNSACTQHYNCILCTTADYGIDTAMHCYRSDNTPGPGRGRWRGGEGASESIAGVNAEDQSHRV